MSEDERALKAARAKALLKKRQQKKPGGVPGTSGTRTPSSPLTSQPISRPFSPAPSDQAEDEQKSVDEVFTPVDSDTSWVNSLPRVGLPAPSVGVSPPPSESSSTLATSQTRAASDASPPIPDNKQILLQSQQQTISLLVSEKATLTTELARLDGIESKVQEKTALLEEEYNKSRELQNHVQRLQVAALESAQRIQTLQSKEKELAEKCRDQERELQLKNASVNELQVETQQHKRRIRYLEEQIQSDDRVERLENSLKNTQDRADELEYQLTKIKQLHAALKADREQVESQLRTHRGDLNEWQTKHSNLQERFSAVERQLATTSKDRDRLSQESSAFQTLVDSKEKALRQHEEKLQLVVTELATSTRQLQNAQADLKHANRRVEEAERIQKDLQAEGTRMMHSLDQMRPEIENLGEKVDSLQHALRKRDATIAQLESKVEDLQREKDDADKRWRETLVLRETERSSAQTNSMELQAAYTELQANVDASRASILAFEAERVNHHQQVARQGEEIDRLTTISQSQWDEISTLRRELDERKIAQEEEQGILERVQNEIESLRLDLSSRDEEIERLRNVVATSPGAPRSLDDEMVNSFQQQRALDLSAALSKNRELETALFEAEAKTHALQKQVNALEATRMGQRPFSPRAPSRPSSRNVNHTDLRRTSFQSNRPSNHPAPPPLTRSVIDIGLSPDARHKRQISLGMLKARIDSEVVALSGHPASRPLSPFTALPPVREPSSQPAPPPPAHSTYRPQFLDESHIFWCHSCHGDLVVL